MPRMASRRLIWPSMLLRQVGELESSKSAMKTLAPELRALMIILRSTGPVISTRRSRRSCGNGGDGPFGGADGGGLGEEVRQDAGIQAFLADAAGGEQFLTAGFEFPREGAEKFNCLIGEDGLAFRHGRSLDGDGGFLGLRHFSDFPDFNSNRAGAWAAAPARGPVRFGRVARNVLRHLDFPAGWVGVELHGRALRGARKEHDE